MTNQTITISLPEPVIRYLRENAAATRQSLEQTIQQSIEGNLPPSIENAPPEMQNELLVLQTLPIPKLKKVAQAQILRAQQERHQVLLEKNSEGLITPEERQELANLRLAADRFMLRKAYAWAILRWRGVAIPRLEELPLE